MLPLTSYFSLVPQDNYDLLFLSQYLTPSLCVHGEGNVLLPFHSSTFAWKIPWMEGPGRLQSMGSPRVGHDWATSLSLFTFMLWRRKWQPTPVVLPGESQGLGEPCGEPGGLPSMGSHRVGHNWSDLAAAAAAMCSQVIIRRDEYWFKLTTHLWTFNFLLPFLLSHHEFSISPVPWMELPFGEAGHGSN